MPRLFRSLVLALLLLTPAHLFAAFSATTHWAVQTAGATTGGAGFDPANASMATDLAATSATGNAPVVTSASYNFIARDVNAWLFIKSGTNWNPGWYQITSVSANAATLNATIGAGIIWPAGNLYAIAPTTVAGVATVASPTAGTWSIDYSQGNAAGIAYTDMASAGAGSTYTSAANPVGPNVVGNIVNVTAGTNFTVARYQIISTATTTATVDKAITTGAGSGGTGNLGGAHSDPALVCGLMIAGDTVWIKSGAYSITSVTANAAGGILVPPAATVITANSRLIGFGSLRGDQGTKPVITANVASIGAGTSPNGGMLGMTTNSYFENLELNGNSQTSVRGVDGRGNGAAASGMCYRCKISNCTLPAFHLNGTAKNIAILCEATGCSGAGNAAIHGGTLIGCVAHDNTVSGVDSYGIEAGDASSTVLYCISYNNTSSDGFGGPSGGDCIQFINCLAYNNNQNGFKLTADPISTGGGLTLINCLAYGHTTGGMFGFTTKSGACAHYNMFNCAGGNNAGGNVDTTNIQGRVSGFVALTANPFNLITATDFSINNAAGGGALLRAAGTPGSVAPNLWPGINTLNYLNIGAMQHRVLHTDKGSTGAR